MVKELEIPQSKSDFPETAPTANPVFYRTYSRRMPEGRENWQEVCDRTINSLKKLGKLTPEETELLYRMQSQLKALSSGRWLWVGGTEWIEKQENFSGAYNCSSTNVVDWRTFGLLMDLAMMGCGTGAVIEPRYIDELPTVKNRLNVILEGEIGATPAEQRREYTEVKIEKNRAKIYVGDSRHGWIGSYQALLELSSDDRFNGEVEVAIDLRDVRPAGEPLKGFGGVANPVKLPDLYQRCVGILNKAVGRQLNSVECCLLIDEAAACIVAGNIRRCIAAGTLVAAVDGMKPIEEIQIGDRVLTSSGEYRPVVNKFVQGVQDVVEIRTPAVSIRCTANHRVAVYNGLRSYTWKRAGELQGGDRLISVPHHRGLDSTSIDRAWLLGFLSQQLADLEPTPETIPTITFVFSKGRWYQDIAEKCLRILRRLGDTPIVSYHKNKGLIRITQKDLALELARYQQPSGIPIIPEFIWKGTAEIRAAFLAGVSDGEGIPGRNILLSSDKLEFLREVQKLALSLGIVTTFQERKLGNRQQQKQVKPGYHNIAIRGLQSQAVTVTLVNQFAVRDRFYLNGNQKKGLSLPDRFVQEVVGGDWQKNATRLLKEAPVLTKKAKNHRPKRDRDANFDTLIAEDLVNPHWLPMEVQFVAFAGRAETFDIEVEGDHEFIANGLLVHNSAGMRQGDSKDEIFAVAKDNLWQQGEDGNWRIDPERDALRMSNHTRVFHRKPTLEECVEAVRHQFYFGEGAIQWAGETVARANRDLLSTAELKRDFLAAYDGGKAEEWLLKRHPDIEPKELEHRLARVGLNPCVTADTWIHTEFGPRQVKDLIGIQHGTFVNGELFSTTKTGFFPTGVQPVFKLVTDEGVSVRLTGNHKVFKVTSQTQKCQYTEWVPAEELQAGDRICLHNHRHIESWSGAGNFQEGWLLGNLVGDGSLAKTQWNDIAILRFWGEFQAEMAEYALATLKSTVTYSPNLAGHYHPQHKLRQICSSGLATLADRFGITQGSKHITPAIERASYSFYCGFLRGLFDADGSVQGSQQKGVSVRLPQSNLALLEAVQRMLLRLGIVSKIYQNRRLEGVRLMPDSQRNLAPYRCKAQHELVVAKDNLAYFRDLIGFQEPSKNERLNALLGSYKRPLYRDRFTATVQALIPDGIEPVYDCTVPGPTRFDANGLVLHNCGEIIGSDFHCVSGNTILITRSGMAPIQSLTGQTVEIWNGKRWSKVTPIQTGTNRILYRVKFGDGTFLDVTEGHRFFVKDRFGKEYEELTTLDLISKVKWGKYALHTEPFTIDYRDGVFVEPIWAYTLGQLVGDGSVCGSQENPSLQLRLYGMKSYQQLEIAGRTSGKLAYYAENPETPCLLYTGFDRNFDGHQVRDMKANAEPLEAIATWNREAILHFIAGLADADGSEVPSGGIRIYLSDRDRAYRIYLLLLKCGIRSSINLLQVAGTETNLGKRQKDLWYLQITDCAAIPCQRLNTRGGHKPKSKRKWQVIRSIEPLEGLHDTFCFNEPEFHKGVFGGTLTGQCNLGEIHLNQIDPNNDKEQEDAFSAGALSVATLLNHQFIVPRYQYSRELDPIVGVSFTGLFDFFVKAFGLDWLRWFAAGRPETSPGLEFKRREAEYLSRWRDIAHRVVWDYCDRHQIKRPNRCTTVQPSGCLDKTALRIFDQGLLYADEVVAPGSGESVGLGLTVRNGVGASTAIANQPLELVEIELANGRLLRMTPNHRMSVGGQWIYASDLQPNMQLDYSIGKYRPSEDALLISLTAGDYTRESRSQKLGHNRGVLTQKISTPTELNPQLAYFLGCLFGNGNVSPDKYRIRFSHGRLDVLHRLQKLAVGLFGIEGNFSDDNSSRFELCFASRQLFDWLHLNQLAKQEKSNNLDRIPLPLRRSSRQTLLSFFCGLIDTDGCVRKDGKLSIDSASEDFIRNLQQIGEAIGLCFSIYHNTQGENLQPGKKNMWGLCLSPMLSNADALEYLNQHSIKCQERPLLPPKRTFKFSPYQIKSVSLAKVWDYSYDFAIEGIDDNDSWYWQGALKSHNTKSLLTNAAPGWHPPFGLRWVRRITFAKNDPVALACLDYGYSVIPGQSDKDENGNLLEDPFDNRVKEWLVEIPVQVSWIDLPGVEEIAIEKFTATTMFDFYMQVQKHWTTHNTSSTILLTEEEIEPLGKRIYEAIRDDEGYISSALLARFDAPFPRLPFERISQEVYERMQADVLRRRQSDDFSELLNARALVSQLPDMGPQDPACSGMTCEIKGLEPL